MGQHPLVSAAADLEARDDAVTADLRLVADLAAGAASVRERARALDAMLAALPGELAELDRVAAQARDEVTRAGEELAQARRRVESLEAKRRPGGDDLDQARRELGTARDAATDARARVERLAVRRSELEERTAEARRAAAALPGEAAGVAARIGSAPRVSVSGRSEPGGSLAELAEWGDRVTAALFVVRGQLETERERIVREATELGASVLGEPLDGSSVATVRRRVEQALGG